MFTKGNIYKIELHFHPSLDVNRGNSVASSLNGFISFKFKKVILGDGILSSSDCWLIYHAALIMFMDKDNRRKKKWQ